MWTISFIKLTENEWLLLSPTFTAKFALVFCLNTGKRFVFENSFYSQEKEHVFFWKTVLRIFEIALCLKDRYDFMWQPLEILNVFTTLTLKLIFWKTKTFFKKPGSCFLVQSAKIEIAIFPYKTALPEANAIRQVEWEVHNRHRETTSLVGNYFIFLKIFFQNKNLF